MADSSGNGGGLGGLLGSIDPSMLANLGLGLINSGSKNSPLRGNWGAGLQQGMSDYYAQAQAKQQLGMGRLQMQQLQQEMPMRMGYLKALGQQLHVANNDPQTPAQVQGLLGSAATPAAPQIPQGAAPQPQGAAPQPQGAAPQPQGMPAPAQGAPMPSPQAGAAQMPSTAVPAAAGGGLGADPMSLMKLGAFGGALGMPGSQGLQELGKTQLQYDPKMATKMEAAKSQVSIDQQQIQDALSGGNTALAAGIAQKMRQDLGLLHIASMSGTQTRIGLGGDISTFNPNEGVQSQNGIESAIPGAANARGQIAAAIAQGEATGKTVELTDPNTGAKYMVPESYVTGGGAGGKAPRGTSPGAPALPPSGGPTMPGAPAGLAPAREAMLRGNAEQALKTNQDFQAQAETGKDMLAATQTLMNSANDFTPGRFADTRGKFMEYANSLGLLSPQDAKGLGAKQEGDKIAIQLQAAATKQLGSREAAQIFDKMGKSLPNLTLSQDGLNKVSGWMMGISRYNIARAADANTKAQASDPTGVNTVRDTWIKNSNPLYYVMASMPAAQRSDMLSSMKNSKQFIGDWNKAANAGFAPRPGDYSGGP